MSAIVKSHGGFVKVESGVKRGAAFRVYLPAMTAGILRDHVSARLVGYALGSALENHDEEGVESDPRCEKRVPHGSALRRFWHGSTITWAAAGFEPAPGRFQGE